MELVPDTGVACCAGGGLGAALEQLMSSQCLPQRWVRRVYRAVELPVRLQRLLCTVGPEAVWRAFTDGTQWWFGIAFERRSTPPRPALEFDAYFLCQDGVVWAGARWTCTSDAGLALCEVYDPTLGGLAQELRSRAQRRGASAGLALPASPVTVTAA